ncbi:Ataxia telangiectasia and Rad3 protein [Fasciola gigantica]|uniref:Ataxia telangiectasia and Rad3 protein n=1 Tax=Fasciola gigantica TaxID=46835 RepID=A0A504YRN0_FASGI|nr:Ataxia telangiectasia and Rad3 protein [Fasciola gigantica]
MPVGIRNTVKYVYCIIDEIAGGVDRMGDSPDAGLLPLLGRIESTFTYRHYQLTQALGGPQMNNFATWCLHRLILISCRPVFAYHLNAVSIVMEKLLVLLERHHLNLFLDQSITLIRLLNDFCSPSQSLRVFAFQDDGLLLQTEPITLVDLRSAYHMITVLCQTLSTVVVSFYSYVPELMVKTCHTFGIVVELCDITSKHCALEALLRAGTCILPSPVDHSSSLFSVTLQSVVEYLRRAVMLSLSTLTDWIERRLPLLPDEVAASNFPGFEQLIVRCVHFLVHIGHPESDKRNGDLLLVIVERLLTQFWTSKIEHATLRGALLDYMAHYKPSHTMPECPAQLDVSVQLKDGTLTGLFDAGNAIPEWSNFTTPTPLLIHQLEMNECKMETVIRDRLDRVSLIKWRPIFVEFHLPRADSSELLHYGPIWLRLGRLWGAFRSKSDLLKELKDVLIDATTHTIKHVVLALPRVDKFPEALDSCGAVAPFLIYAGLRLIAQSLAVLSELSNENVLGETLSLSLFNWTVEFSLFTQSEDFPTTIWSCLCEPTLHVGYATVLWCARVTPKPISVEQFSHVIGSLVLSSLALDPCRIGTSVHCFTRNLPAGGVESSFMLSVARKLLRDLINRSHRTSLSKIMAVFLASLSSVVVCLQSGCAGASSLYCQNQPVTQTGCTETSDQSKESDLEAYTVTEQMELLNLLLDMRHVEVTYEAVVDLTMHLSHHVSWIMVSGLQIVEFLSLIQNELPHYTPPVVRAIYSNVSTRLSDADLNAWLDVHTQLVQFIHTRPRQGPSSALDTVLLDEYRVLQYGALGCCLARHYANLLCLSPPARECTNFVDRRNSGEAAGFTCTSVSDGLIGVVAALCRLGLTHQYTHALYGALEDIMRMVHMKSVHVLRLCREKIAQVIAEYTDQGLGQVMECLARLFRLEKTAIFKELVGPLFIALVLRGNQESHLHIRHLVNEVPYCSPTQVNFHPQFL